MNLDFFMIVYMVIAIIYSIFGFIFALLDEMEFPNPFLALPIVVVSVIGGWLIFPILLFYNIFIKKRII